MTTTTLLRDAEELRTHLDRINEAGLDHLAAGIDDHGYPFLIGLSGPYAETEYVIKGSPWDPEVDYATGTRCDDCGAGNLSTVDDLAYPVTVLVHPDLTAAPSPAPSPATAVVQPSVYSVHPSGWENGDNDWGGHHFLLRIENRGQDRWCVTDGAVVFNAAGESEYEPAAEAARYPRFDLDTATALALRLVDTRRVNGGTFAEVKARTR